MEPPPCQEVVSGLLFLALLEKQLMDTVLLNKFRGHEHMYEHYAPEIFPGYLNPVTLQFRHWLLSVLFKRCC